MCLDEAKSSRLSDEQIIEHVQNAVAIENTLFKIATVAK